MTRTYKYTGQDPKDFPTLGVTLEPGETVETDKKVDHPELEEVKRKAKES